MKAVVNHRKKDFTNARKNIDVRTLSWFGVFGVTFLAFNFDLDALSLTHVTSLRRGQLGDLGDPLCDVNVVRVHAAHPGVGEQRGEVGPLVGVLPQAAVHEVAHLGRVHLGGQLGRRLVNDVLEELEDRHRLG